MGLLGFASESEKTGLRKLLKGKGKHVCQG